MCEANDVEIQYYNLKGETPILHMCPGDLYVICNVLHDYVSLLKEFMECVEEEKEYTHAFYGYHATRCKKIQEKIEVALSYSTEEAIRKCRKKRKREDDVGEDALVIIAKKRANRAQIEPEEKGELGNEVNRTN